MPCTDPSPALPTVAQALQQARQQGLERLDAQILLLHSLGRPSHDRAWLIAHDRQPLTAAAQQAFAALCQRRRNGEPVAYLTGRKEFYGLPLAISPAVLDPRPDTETLVDWALQCVANIARPRILDLGTGSGAIALALQHQRPDARITAIDASAAALRIAQQNGERLRLPVQWLHGNWFEPLPQAGQAGGEPFDLIVSNPPYLASGDAHLPGLRHEPQAALVSHGPHGDGLDDLRHIIAAAPDRLRPGGWLLLEHGWQQHAAVRQLLADAGLGALMFRHDLAGHIRCTGGQRTNLQQNRSTCET